MTPLIAGACKTSNVLMPSFCSWEGDKGKWVFRQPLQCDIREGRNVFFALERIRATAPIEGAVVVGHFGDMMS